MFIKHCLLNIVVNLLVELYIGVRSTKSDAPYDEVSLDYII